MAISIARWSARNSAGIEPTIPSPRQKTRSAEEPIGEEAEDCLEGKGECEIRSRPKNSLFFQSHGDAYHQRRAKCEDGMRADLGRRMAKALESAND